jgi:hypothetical protein
VSGWCRQCSPRQANSATVCAGNLRVTKLQEAQGTQYNRPRPSDEEVEVLKAKTPAPVILHLDSISGGGHNSGEICMALRDWLRCALPELAFL